MEDQEILQKPTHSKLVEHRTVEEVMEDNFLRYSLSVIIDRALPDVRDGLKPVHRRILYSMNKNNWKFGAKYTKSARITGDVMGKYHPHGDTAIYDSMVRLAQDWNMRYTLVDGQGNFGSMDGDPAAAPRYTEARMDKISNEMLSDIDKDTVDFRPNYDGSEQEPSVLPAKLPNLLLNGQVGIAVGMATSIPPHNLGEIIDGIQAQIDNPEIEIDELLKYVKGPDFPTGGIVYTGTPMKQAYKTGRGSVKIRGKAEIVETKKRGRYQIIISEMPYAVNKASMIERIAELVKTKRINSISDLRDESARGEVKVVIDLKKDAYPKKVLNQLYKMSPLQTTFHYNMLALIGGVQPKILNLKEIFAEYITHRQKVVRRRTEFELRKAKARAHILEGLKIALDHIDEVIKVIRASKNDQDTEQNLMEKFKLSLLQAKAIMSMQLRRLNGLNRKAIEDELTELIKLIAELEKILADENLILSIIKDELVELKEKFADKRRSKIIKHELGGITEEELIPEEDVVIILTNQNYIKRTLVSDYRRQNRGGKGKRGITTKDQDFIDQIVSASTHDYLLFFTNKGRVFRLKAFEVPAASLIAKGTAAVNLLQLQPEENITSVIKIPTNVKEGYLFMATVKGTVKKTAIEKYANIRTNGLISIKLDEGDELRYVKQTTGKDEVILSTSGGQAIRFSENDVRSMGRSARGVRGARLRPNDKVVGLDVVSDECKNLLVISQNGYGKMTKISSFSTHRRGGIGIKEAAVTKKTGPIISARAISDDIDELIIISQKGQTIRVSLKDVPVSGRSTQGVRIMRLNDDDSVASIGVIMKSESEDIE